MSSSINDRIRKLLALSESSNPNEADNALRMASELMLRHGITQDQLREPSPVGVGAQQFGTSYVYWELLCIAVGNLVGCAVVSSKANDVCAFVGRPDNIAAAEQLVEYLVDQVNAYYRRALPRGLSKTERAVFRHDFKRGACVRIFNRVDAIERERKASSKELITHRDSLVNEAMAFLNEKGAGRRELNVNVRPSEAAYLGDRAGAAVNLSRPIDGGNKHD